MSAAGHDGWSGGGGPLARSITRIGVFAFPAAFILLPLLAFLTYSFFWTENGQTHYGLTLRNYQRFFTDPVFLPVLARTCILCMEVAALAVLAGYPVAYFLSGLNGVKKHVLLMLMLVPLLMSYVIKIYAIRSILGGNGFLNRALLGLGIIDTPSMFFVFNLNAVLLTLTVLLIPFAVLPIFLSLERIPRSLVDASADLGASSLQTFLRVILPLSMTGTVTAFTFVFVLAIGDFLTPQMVGGQSGFTFGRVIYSQFGTAFNWPFGAALSVILAAVVVLAIAAGAVLGRQTHPGGSTR